jgi:hypothetical protein
MPVVPAAEKVIGDVSQRAYEAIDKVLDAIAPDGRPFGMRKKSEREQLKEYMEEGLHDNPEAALNWMRTRAAEMQKRMEGLPPDIVQSVHVYDIVQRYAMVYSSKMEALLLEEKSKDSARRTAPSISTEPLEIDEDAGF